MPLNQGPMSVHLAGHGRLEHARYAQHVGSRRGPAATSIGSGDATGHSATSIKAENENSIEKMRVTVWSRFVAFPNQPTRVPSLSHVQRWLERRAKHGG